LPFLTQLENTGNRAGERPGLPADGCVKKFCPTASAVLPAVAELNKFPVQSANHAKTFWPPLIAQSPKPLLPRHLFFFIVPFSCP